MDEQTNEQMMADLADLDKPFQDEEVHDPNEKVPDGRYQARVEKAYLGYSKPTEFRPDPIPVLNWHLKIVTGEHKGRMLFHRNRIVQESIRWLKQDLLVCGIQLPKLSQLGEFLPALVGLGLQVKVTTSTGKTGIEYQNLYLQNRVVLPEGEGDAAPADDGGDFAFGANEGGNGAADNAEVGDALIPF